MRVGLKMIVPFGTVCAQSIVPDEKLLDSMKRLVKVLVLYMHPGAHADVRVWHVVGQIYQRFHADLEEMEIDGRRREVILVPAKYLWLDAIRLVRNFCAGRRCF